MDYALELVDADFNDIESVSFNPCFSGLCFGTELFGYDLDNITEVLILVLVDYALEPFARYFTWLRL